MFTCNINTTGKYESHALHQTTLVLKSLVVIFLTEICAKLITHFHVFHQPNIFKKVVLDGLSPLLILTAQRSGYNLVAHACSSLARCMRFKNWGLNITISLIVLKLQNQYLQYVK